MGQNIGSSGDGLGRRTKSGRELGRKSNQPVSRGGSNTKYILQFPQFLQIIFWAISLMSGCSIGRQRPLWPFIHSTQIDWPLPVTNSTRHNQSKWSKTTHRRPFSVNLLANQFPFPSLFLISLLFPSSNSVIEFLLAPGTSILILKNNIFVYLSSSKIKFERGGVKNLCKNVRNLGNFGCRICSFQTSTWFPSDCRPWPGLYRYPSPFLSSIPIFPPLLPFFSEFRPNFGSVFIGFPLLSPAIRRVVSQFMPKEWPSFAMEKFTIICSSKNIHRWIINLLGEPWNIVMLIIKIKGKKGTKH